MVIRSEQDSQQYRLLSRVIAPNRDEQLATLLCLAPIARDASARIADLGVGEGAFTYAFLECFPNATAVALDISEEMRRSAARNLARFGDRVQIEHFSLAEPDWYPLVDGVDCVVSGLCIHHLTGAEKQLLFRELYKRIRQGGALLINDAVNPDSQRAHRLYGEHWDALVKQAIRDIGAPPELFDRFDSEHWNYFNYHPEVDHPSPLFDQLTWLRNAGFVDADCFWLRASHCVYGGYHDRNSAQPDQLNFDEALGIARRALDATLGS